MESIWFKQCPCHNPPGPSGPSTERSMRLIAGLLFISTALVNGGAMLYLIGRASIGGPSSWLYPAALIASILMLFSGVLTLIGWANKVRLVALIGSLMLVLWWVPALAYTLYVYFSPGSP